MSIEKTSNSDIEEVLEGDETSEVDDTDDFFDNLEASVNNIVTEGSDAVSQPETEQETQQADTADTGNENKVDWKIKAETLEKRYGDSSREAQRLKTENDSLQEMSKFKPLIEHLKNNPDSVQALRDSLNGKSRSLTEQYGEDFVFDAHEAMSDPNSDSAKVMNEHIAITAGQQAQAIVNQEKQRFTQEEQVLSQQLEARDFMKRAGMSEAEFVQMREAADQHTLTLDDIYFLLNRDQVSKNVADNTKADMLNQMKNVRDIPQSASNANSPGGATLTPDDKVFNVLKGLDESAEDLFS